MKNPYKEVIKQLERKQDWRKIVFLLASMHPSVILKVIHMLEDRDKYKDKDKTLYERIK